MNKNDFFIFGSIIKLHGYKGAVVIKILSAFNRNFISKKEPVFVEINQQLVPFFIETFSLKNNEWAYLHFSGIDNEAKAKKLLKSSVWLPNSFLPKTSGKKLSQTDISDYSVHDSKYGDLGKIHRIIPMQHYPLLELMKEQKEILIPAAEEIIIKIDRRKKIIFIKAPDGLIDMYMQ